MVINRGWKNKKAEQNKVSKSIPQLKKKRADTSEVFAQMKELSNEIKILDDKVKLIEEEIEGLNLFVYT